MEKDLTLDMMLTERWSNNACRGYVIWAMENCDFKPEDIRPCLKNKSCTRNQVMRSYEHETI